MLSLVEVSLSQRVTSILHRRCAKAVERLWSNTRSRHVILRACCHVCAACRSRLSDTC